MLAARGTSRLPKHAPPRAGATVKEIRTHSRRRAAALCLLSIASILAPVACRAQDQDLSANYTWAPVQIGAGGWMRGMAISPSDPTRMFARGDVENLYRWNVAAQTWVPTKLASAFPAGITAQPANAGAGAIAIDPANPDHILVAYQMNTSTDLTGTSSSIAFNLNVYASWDGGVTFRPGNLSLSGSLSSETSGERLAFDPNNGNVAYFGSPGAQGAGDGLYRTTDGGLTWTQVTGGGYLANSSSVRYESQLPRIDAGSGTAQPNGQAVSTNVYVTYITHDETRGDAVSGGGVIMSADGGQTWTDVTDAAANNLCSASAQLCWATIDTDGNLWVTDGNASHNIFRRSRAGTWTTVATPSGGTGGIAVDPTNSRRIFIDAGDVLQRSLDGGQTWVTLGSHYTWSANQPILWLNPSPFRPQGYYVSESGLYFDSKGNLWQPCGNNGVITFTPNDATDSPANPPVWTSLSEGIEEMETSAAAIPPGGIPVLGVADESEFSIPDPDTYTAKHYPIDTFANGGYGLGMSQDIAYAPNAPTFIVAPDANDETSQGTMPQFQYGGSSADGGNTWTLFPSIVSGTHPCVLYGGEIAVSARPSGRQNAAPGADNIVWFPTNAGDANTQFGQVPAPFYSTDGGATWTQSQSFNSVSGATTASECASNTTYTFLPAQMGDWLYILAQHQLLADPLTPGTFYLKMTVGNASGTDGGFWKSTDGGKTWAETAGAAQVPRYTHWGRMAANPSASGDLWLADGWEGAASHGLFHTTDGGTSFTKSAAFTYAWQVALGKAAPSQSYPAIYVYGLLAGDAQWGIFQSIDGGSTFNRISYYPYGIFDIPYDMAASWDVFGTVYVGFSGNSFYYAQDNSNDPQASAPTFSPAGGSYSAAQAVTISSTTPHATIYYTTDGSKPTSNSNLYGGAIAVSSGSETISAMAVASGYAPSAVTTATYTLSLPQAATPAITPAGGTFTSAQTVTLADTTPNAAIYYTTDGNTPTANSPRYSGAITVSASETLQAIAVAPGYANSSVASAAFTIHLPPPSFSLGLSPTSLTIQSGASGTVTLTVTPANGFSAAVSFACSGLPASSACSFNPQTVTPSGSAASTQMTVSSSAVASAAPSGSAPLLPATAFAATVFLLGWKKRSGLLALLLLASLAVAGLAPLGCGGSSGTQPPPPVQATVTVTAASGSLQQTATLSLTVN